MYLAHANLAAAAVAAAGCRGGDGIENFHEDFFRVVGCGLLVRRFQSGEAVADGIDTERTQAVLGQDLDLREDVGAAIDAARGVVGLGGDVEELQRELHGFLLVARGQLDGAGPPAAEASCPTCAFDAATSKRFPGRSKLRFMNRKSRFHRKHDWL